MFQELAERSHAASQFVLAQTYEKKAAASTGGILKGTYAELAVYWVRRASAKIPWARFLLGSYMSKGYGGLTQDPLKGARTCMDAAEWQLSLGANKEGKVRGFEFFEAARKMLEGVLGRADPEVSLSVNMMSTRLRNKAHILAAEWFEQAANLRDKQAREGKRQRTE